MSKHSLRKFLALPRLGKKNKKTASGKQPDEASRGFVHPLHARQLEPALVGQAQGGQVNIAKNEAHVASNDQLTNLGVSPAKSMLIPKVDFKVGAKAHKHSTLKHAAVRGLVVGLYVIAFVMALAASAGFYINYKYANRALPFSYVGDMSVGGLTESEVKAALDEKLSTMQITFVDGGLERQVPIKQFGVRADTAAAAYQATHTPFNPLAYLNKRQFEVDATVNERQVAGYIDLVINRGKTNSEDARIIVEKKKLKIFPETQGFRTNAQFINDRIKNSLISVKAPVVNVNVSTIKPNVYATDLEDDLARANSMLNTNVSLVYNGTTLRPSLDEKLSWLQVSSVPGATNVQLSFSRSLVRQYVVAQANKFQAGIGMSGPDAKNALAVTQKGTVIDNIDEATDGLISSLTNMQPHSQRLSSKIGTYNKLVSAKP